MTSLLLPVAALRPFARDLLLAMGSPSRAADKIAASLINSNMRGSNTHGLGLLPIYARMVDDGAIDPLATATITHRTDCIISIQPHVWASLLKLAGKLGVKVADEIAASKVSENSPGEDLRSW